MVYSGIQYNSIHFRFEVTLEESSLIENANIKYFNNDNTSFNCNISSF